MRLALALVALLATSPVYAQRIFRASIDEVQDERLDAVEDKVDDLHQSVKVLAQAVTLLAESKKEAKPQQASYTPHPQEKKVVLPPAPAPRIVQPARSSLAAIAWQTYPDGRYRVRYADVQPRSQVWNHLIQHGFSQAEVQGLSQFEALVIHDLAHGGKVHPGQASSLPAPVQRAAPQVQYANYDIGCANGQCARPGVSYSRSRPRLFGLFR